MSETYNGFGLGDAVVNAAMSGGFNGNRGGGNNWNGGGGIVAAPFADIATVQHGIGHLEGCVRGGNENVLREFSFNHQSDVAMAHSADMGRNMLQLTRDQADSDRATQKGFADMALEMCKCCKDAEITAIKEAGKTQALIVKENSETRLLFINTKLQEATDKNNINETVSGINAAAAANTAAIIQALGNQSYHGSH